MVDHAGSTKARERHIYELIEVGGKVIGAREEVRIFGEENKINEIKSKKKQFQDKH